MDGTEGTFVAPPGMLTADAPATTFKDRTGAVKVAAGLNLALGGLLAIAALVTWIGLGSLAEFLRAEGQSENANEVVMGRIVFTAVLALVGTPYLVAATAVYYRRNWGRVLLFIVSGVGVLLVPVGTLIAIVTFWALSRPGAEPWFAGAAPGAPP